MLVLAAQGEVNTPTAREQEGAAKIVAQFPVIMAFWPEGSKDSMSEAVKRIGEMPKAPKRPEPSRRIPPALEGVLSGAGAVA